MKKFSTYTLMAGIFSMLVLSMSTFGAAVVRRGQGADVNAVIPAISQFTGDLGGSSHGNGGSYTTGYRVIRWDDVPDNVGPIVPATYFNTTVPLGMVVSSACGSLIVSSSGANGAPLRFGDYHPLYTNDFQSIFGTKLSSVDEGICNYVDVYFYIPGTKTPATVKGFSVVFTDVDDIDRSAIECFGIDGQPLTYTNPLPFNNGLSFVGISFNNGERIARVRVYSGSGFLGNTDNSHGGTHDIVVMDSFIYGEPRAIGQHSSDFDGDGTSDYAVFRPSNGTWYAMQSGSNTLVATQFGTAGDIPVDGDFDGDSRNDLAVFRPSTGAWYILRTSNGQFQGTSFGLNGDKPVAGDYDKDGITDIAVWRPSNGNYYYLKSSNGQFAATHFGATGDIPIGAAGL